MLLIKNKALLAMVVSFTLYNTRNMGMGALTTIFFKNILGDIKLLALSRTIGFVATWLITPLIPLLTLKFDMKKAFLGSYLIFTLTSFAYAIPAIGLNPTWFIAVNTIGKAIVPILGTLFSGPAGPTVAGGTSRCFSRGRGHHGPV
jgi:Na+/melibiose symporter-like transporter